MSLAITVRQSDTLEAIVRLTQTLGRSPNVNELAAALSITGANAHQHIQALEKKGYIERGGFEQRRRVISVLRMPEVA